MVWLFLFVCIYHWGEPKLMQRAEMLRESSQVCLLLWGRLNFANTILGVGKQITFRDCTNRLDFMKLAQYHCSSWTGVTAKWSCDVGASR